MEAESIVLPQKLGKMLREKAEETGYLPEEFGVKVGRTWWFMVFRESACTGEW